MLHSVTAAVILAAPKLSLECRADVLFPLAGSAAATPEGFLWAKASVKQFVPAALSEDSRARMGVARYGAELAVAVTVTMGEYRDVRTWSGASTTCASVAAAP
ncbi:hypothetical protein J1605_022077 [Eschrichtius robustus]|uniref:Uncharacterized protein n=1 Tax=Eschrichtius robustus TaxID=9764 RepID=A0AB34HEX6_ESCRO|nr:hypothetical protein J1605_022077 [Eschrichtius robustus]